MTAEQRLPLSVCLIAGAEAHRIRRTLDSVTGWVAEIIVVINDDVTDGTDQIAAACDAKVFRESWKGYGPQKNSANDKATQPWLLNLDADEVVSPALRDEIIQVITAVRARADSPYVAYSFPRCTFYFGRWIRHGDWYPDRIARLWQRGRGQWQGIVHEKLVVQGRTGHLRSELLHYSMESLDHQVHKMLLYADDFARQCRMQGRRVGILDLLIRPPWRFFRSFVLKLGFLDGWPGLSIAWTTAFYTFLRYAKAREAQVLPPH